MIIDACSPRHVSRRRLSATPACRLISRAARPPRHSAQHAMRHDVSAVCLRRASFMLEVSRCACVEYAAFDAVTAHFVYMCCVARRVLFAALFTTNAYAMSPEDARAVTVYKVCRCRRRQPIRAFMAPVLQCLPPTTAAACLVSAHPSGATNQKNTKVGNGRGSRHRSMSSIECTGMNVDGNAEGTGRPPRLRW